MKKRILSILLIIFIINILACFSLPVFAAGPDAIQAANTLYTLGLFKGTGTNSDGTPIYELDLAPTRFQAITMLVRLLGRDETAQAGNWSFPFTDVPDWAAPYVGYAYANGLTQGVGTNEFGGDALITANQYITFLLRALGYDSSSDFNWDQALEFSDKLGLTNGEYNDKSEFYRSDIAALSVKALSQYLKNTNTYLLARLYSDGVIDFKKVVAAGMADLLNQQKMTAAQASAKASPAVFYLEVYERDTDYAIGRKSASGSGFFISKEGVAVTNYHVIEGTSSAYITTIDGLKYKVKDVIYYNEKRDIAVLRVSKTSTTGEENYEFPFVKMVSSDTVCNGDQVFAIGSPLGLQNTISDGIVSNSCRIFGGGDPFIQTTAAISTGSSGGVLLNEYGEAIGITTASVLFSQNINLAVPLDSILDLELDISGVPYEKVYEDIKDRLKSASVGYEDFEYIPDFGSYFKVSSFYRRITDVSVFYSYKVEELMSYGSYMKVLEDYDMLLKVWGFDDTGYFYNEDDFYITIYKNAENQEVYFGPTYHNNTLTLCVMIIKDKPS